MDVNIGDVVQLASGGPPMTVCEYPVKGLDGSVFPEQVKCEWFNEDNQLKHALFNIKELIIKK